MHQKHPWLWLSAALALCFLFVLVRWRNAVRTHEQQSSGLHTRIAADEAFIEGDSLKAFSLYAELNDTALMAQRQQVWSAMKQDASREAVRVRTIVRPKVLKATDEETITYYQSLTDSLDEALRQANTAIQTLQQRKQDDVSLQFRPSTSKDFVQFTAGKKREMVNYTGETQNGKANGLGVAVWKNGSMYQGEWKDNMRHGHGSYQWADGERYEGDYLNDLRHGFGIYTTKNGEQYRGLWAEDKRHGEGRLYDKKGVMKLHGIWDNDKLVKTLKE